MGHNGSPVVFRRDTPLVEMLAAVGGGLQPIYPVVNTDGTIYGIIDLGEMRALLAAPHPAPGVVVAEDLCGAGWRVLHAGDSLATALRTLRGTLIEALPVVGDNGSGPLVGVLSRRDISNAYHDYLYRASQENRPAAPPAEITSPN